jgi:metal-responsive CopG/Arc/MetJ family transcriptional regulator
MTVVIPSEVKTAISLPDDVFRAVDAQAKRLKVSRSELFARAAVRLLATLEDERVTASYDEGFADAARPALRLEDVYHQRPWALALAP